MEFRTEPTLSIKSQKSQYHFDSFCTKVSTFFPRVFFFPLDVCDPLAQDAAAWAASLQQAQLAAETEDSDELRRRLRAWGRLSRTECEALNPLAPPFKVGKNDQLVGDVGHVGEG